MKEKDRIYILAVLILLFSVVAFLILNNNNFILRFDYFINNYFINNQSGPITNLMLSITKIGNFYEASIIFIIFGILLFLKKKKLFYTFTIATLLGALLPWIIKLLIQRDRPSFFLEKDYSFPSAHATISTVFLLSSIYLLAPLIIRKISKKIFIIASSIIFPLVAFSRIYLSAHWTSDVIAGIILGSICFASSMTISCYKKKNVL